jgi:hypothetical protein
VLGFALTRLDAKFEYAHSVVLEFDLKAAGVNRGTLSVPRPEPKR